MTERRRPAPGWARERGRLRAEGEARLAWSARQVVQPYRREAWELSPADRVRAILAERQARDQLQARVQAHTRATSTWMHAHRLDPRTAVLVAPRAARAGD